MMSKHLKEVLKHNWVKRCVSMYLKLVDRISCLWFESERERESSLLNHNLLIFSQWSCSWSPACIAYACTFCKPTAVTYRTEAGQDCPATLASPHRVKGEMKVEMSSFHPLCLGLSLRPLAFALACCPWAVTWSPSVSADSRDERDGAGRVLGHWALYADGRPWQGCFHASTPSRQPSERLILSFLCVFPLPFLLPPFHICPSFLDPPTHFSLLPLH